MVAYIITPFDRVSIDPSSLHLIILESLLGGRKVHDDGKTQSIAFSMQLFMTASSPTNDENSPRL